MTGEEVDDSARECVIPVTSHHMTRTGDVDELDLGESFTETLRTFGADEITHPSSDQHHRHTVIEDPAHGGVETILIGHLGGTHIRHTLTTTGERRIPMPVPPAASFANVLAEAIQVRWPRTMRVVRRHRVSDFIE